jgi:type II secretory pathway pseudopilin PulG
MTTGERGYAMAALLVALSVMSVMLSVAMPVWRTATQREREAELIFRGEQYAHAIDLYSRRNGGYPPSLDVLEKGRFIRKLYKDPVSGESDFQPVFVGQVIAGQPVMPRQPATTGPGGSTGAGQQTPTTGPARAGQPVATPFGQAAGQPGVIGGGPVIGVVSRSTAESIRQYHGRGRYNEWAFVATAMSQQAGAPNGPQVPGTTGPGRGAHPGTLPGIQLPGTGPASPAGGAPPRGGFGGGTFPGAGRATSPR